VRYYHLFFIVLLLSISACSTEQTKPTDHAEKDSALASSLEQEGVKVWIKKYDHGDRYEGELKDGKRNGRGIYIYPDGSRYTGEWRNGQKHGWGIYKWTNGNQYEGEWANGDRHGSGTLVFADGGIYRGTWVNGKTGDSTTQKNSEEYFTPISEKTYPLKDTPVPQATPQAKYCSDLTPPKLACSSENREEKAFAMCAIKAGGCYVALNAYGDKLNGLGRVAYGAACEALVVEMSGEEYKIENLLEDVALGIADEMADSALKSEDNSFFGILSKTAAVATKLYIGGSMFGKFESCMADAEMTCSELYDDWKREQNCI